MVNWSDKKPFYRGKTKQSVVMTDARVCELIDKELSRLPSLGRTAAPGKYVAGKRDKTL